MSKSTIITCCFVLLFLLSFGGFGSAQNSAPPTTPPRYNFGPITDYDNAEPSSTDVLRFRRGERYNDPNSAQTELGEASDAIHLRSGETHFKRDLLPFDGSDEVVAGTVTAGQAFLSNDKRRIYSEFKVEVKEVIKTSSGAYLRAGDSIDIERIGGRIKLPSGKILVRGNTPDSMPEIGGRYVFFLKFDPNTADYPLVTGYQLEGSQVYRLDDMRYEDSNWQDLNHPLRRETKSEAQFLQHELHMPPSLEMLGSCDGPAPSSIVDFQGPGEIKADLKSGAAREQSYCPSC